jgi:hypothetical protein
MSPDRGLYSVKRSKNQASAISRDRSSIAQMGRASVPFDGQCPLLAPSRPAEIGPRCLLIAANRKTFAPSEPFSF